MNPSTAQILEAVEATSANNVIVLPNNKNIIPVAQQVDALTERHVEVVATTSIVEALAALVGYDPDADLGANVAALTEAAARVRTGEVTRAVRDAADRFRPRARGRLDRDRRARHLRVDHDRGRRGDRAPHAARRRRRARSSPSSSAPRPGPATPRTSASTWRSRTPRSKPSSTTAASPVPVPRRGGVTGPWR